MANDVAEQDRVCVGVIVGAHGIRGQVRVKSFTAAPEHLDAYGPLFDESGTRSYRLGVVGRSKGVVLCSVGGVDDRNQAEALKGTRLWLDRTLLPGLEDDEFYHSDLIGLRVEFADGTLVGEIVALYDFGAGDLMEIRGPEGGAVMVPFTRDSIPVIDIAGRRVVAERIPGLLEEPPAPGATGARKRSPGKDGKGKKGKGSLVRSATAAPVVVKDWPDEDWH